MPAQTENRIESLTREIETLRKSRHAADNQMQALMLKAAEIQLNLAMQDKTLGKLDTAIHGNGHPGLVTRVDRIERLTGGLTKVTWLLTAAAATAIVKALSNH